ncbi:MAG: virulence protein RhuM/Fic/DOC family protein, partial [Pseudomonadota bacterium]
GRDVKMYLTLNIIIYQNENNNSQVEVRLTGNDLWLSLNQIAELFGRDRSVIGKHLKNIFDEEELDKNSVGAFFALTAQDGKTYQVEHFSLDAIISVGYRVNSKQGTQFRKWATKVLNGHLTKGYSINQSRLDKYKIEELQQTLRLLSNTLQRQNLVDDMGREVINIIEKYSRTWDLLLRYDEGRLDKPAQKDTELAVIAFEEAKLAIDNLKLKLMSKKEASNLFGNMKDKQLESILLGLDQSFAGSYLYSSNIERAAHLLYFVIKDHPFSDGNKRIGCLLFLIFMSRAKLNAPDNNNLIALALLVAESDPKQKDLMIKLIMNLIGN